MHLSFMHYSDSQRITVQALFFGKYGENEVIKHLTAYLKTNCNVYSGLNILSVELEHLTPRKKITPYAYYSIFES